MVNLLKRDVADDVLTILIAILFFQSIPRLPFVGQYFEQYPLIIIGVAVLLLAYRKKIIQAIGGR